MSSLAETNKSNETRIRELEAGGTVAAGGNDKVELGKIVVKPRNGTGYIKVQNKGF